VYREHSRALSEDQSTCSRFGTAVVSRQRLLVAPSDVKSSRATGIAGLVSPRWPVITPSEHGGRSILQKSRLLPRYHRPRAQHIMSNEDAYGPWVKRQPAVIYVRRVERQPTTAGPLHHTTSSASCDLVTRNENGESVLRYEDPHEENEIRQLQQDALSALTPLRPATVPANPARETQLSMLNAGAFGPWVKRQPEMAAPPHPNTRSASRDVVTHNVTGETLLRSEDPHEDNEIRQLQQDVSSALTASVTSHPGIFTQETAGVDDIRDQEIAALRSEIHRLRAALVRTKDEDVEPPPAYC
jgi:hypothetical protein